MKPLRLTLSAVGSFPREETIDFSALPTGVFLIAGPTGAGKTTLFDCLTYALYGETSGGSRRTDSLRSGFAHPDTPTYVQLEFEHQGRKWLVRRKPAQTRPSKRGSGFVKTPEELLLITPTGQELTRKEEVNGTLRAALGLDVQQFRQTSMIAQGEFQKLLTATSQERSEILRHLFETEVVKNFQEQIKNLAKGAESGYESFRQQGMALIQQAKFTTSELLEKQEQWLQEIQSGSWPAGEPTEWFLSQQEQDLYQLDIKQAALKQLQEEIAVQQESLVQATLRDQHLQKAQILQTQIEETEDDCPAREKALEEGETLKQWFLSVYPLEKQETESRTREQHLREKLQGCLADKETLAREQTLFQKRAEEVQTRSNERFDHQLRLQHLQTDEPRQAQIFEKKTHLNQQQQTLSSHVNILQKLQERILRMGERETELREAISQEMPLRETIRDNQDYLREIEEQNQNWGKLAHQWHQLMDMENTLEIQRQAIGEIQSETESRQRELQRVESLWLRQQAASLAMGLDEETPCPVCGSRHHPCLATYAEEEIGQTSLTALREAYTQQAAELQEQVSQWKSLSAQQEIQIHQFLEEGNRLQKIRYSLEAMSPFASELTTKEDLPSFSEFSEMRENLKAGKSKIDELLDQERAASQRSLEIVRLDLEHNQQKLSVVEAAQRELTELGEQITSLQRQQTENLNCQQALEREQSAAQAIIETLSASLIFPDYSMAELERQKALETQWLQETKNLEKQIQEKEENLTLRRENLTLLESTLTLQIKHEIAQQQKIQQELSKEKKKLSPHWDLRSVNTFKVKSSSTVEDWIDPQSSLQQQTLTLTVIEESLKKLREEEERAERLKQALQEEEKQLKDLAGVPQTEEIRAHLEEQNKVREEQAGEQATLCARRDHNQQLLTQWKRLEEKRDQKGREMVMLNELTQVAEGRLTGGHHRSFEVYIQGLWFDQLVLQANRRLESLTDGRYTFVHAQEALDARRQGGLDLLVQDRYIGQNRRLSTLSGGESFLAALSLALGLSDIACRGQAGLAIETLFIDEGFGSLDPEALRKAVRVLTSLSQEKYLCGIISHVEALKEEIPNQIEVVKTPRGSFCQCSLPKVTNVVN